MGPANAWPKRHRDPARPLADHPPRHGPQGTLSRASARSPPSHVVGIDDPRVVPGQLARTCPGSNVVTMEALATTERAHTALAGSVRSRNFARSIGRKRDLEPLAVTANTGP